MTYNCICGWNGGTYQWLRLVLNWLYLQLFVVGMVVLATVCGWKSCTENCVCGCDGCTYNCVCGWDGCTCNCVWLEELYLKLCVWL